LITNRREPALTVDEESKPDADDEPPADLESVGSNAT
jgi:hypothetical protein